MMFNRCLVVVIFVNCVNVIDLLRLAGGCSNGRWQCGVRAGTVAFHATVLTSP